MIRLKILGIGSPFGADQAGWKVADILSHELSNHPGVTIERLDRPGVRLIGLMSGAKAVFLVDAVKTGSPIGTIHRFKDTEIDELKNMLSTHDMGVAQALALGRSLNELPEQVILYGIEIDTIDFNSMLSEPIIQAINQVSILIKKEVIEHRDVS